VLLKNKEAAVHKSSRETLPRGEGYGVLDKERALAACIFVASFLYYSLMLLWFLPIISALAL
jgi:hypothetical protein